MNVISVNQLTRQYETHKKEKGLLGSIKGFIRRTNVVVEAVTQVSFSIEKAELVGFIGPNGAGKTTTLKMLSGLLYPTSGSVQVLGFTPWERKRQYLNQISLIMGQKNQLWWDLPAQESFYLNKEIYHVSDSQFRKLLNRLVGLLEFEKLLDIPVRKLSLGERMKAELIASLIHSPEILFLDEPTIGLDVVMQERIRSFIKEYNRESQTTILLTSHYMEDVKELCKRVIMIDHGKIVFDGELQKLIARYARFKSFEVILEKEVSRNDLEAIGEVKKIEYPKVILSIPRERAKEAAIQLYSRFPIEDLNIHEPDLAEVVRSFFVNSNYNDPNHNV